MKIVEKTVVSLKYKLSNHKTGEQIEVTDETNPLVFLYGVGMLIPEFEQNLHGKATDETFSFAIQAANAYGEVDAQNVATIPTNIFHDENGVFDAAMFQVGSMIPMSDNEGNHLSGKILSITDENVQMDFNHPLAGTDLHFEGSILEVRAATQEELDHGHVHGAHGHQH